MNKKTLTILLALVAALLLAISVFIYVAQDRTSPVISFDDSLTEWSEEDGREVLLSDVTATDNRDGDVSDSLRVRSVIPSEDKTTVTVIYVALDKSNNVGTASRRLKYIPS